MISAARRGYTVNIGKADKDKIRFIAIWQNTKVDIHATQVIGLAEAESMSMSDQ